ELLYVGRLVSDKGVDVLLRALRILKQQDISAHLTIIGRGPEETNVRVMVRKLGLDQAVTFAGEKTGEELAEIMNHHQIIVILSHPTGNENVRHAALAFAESNLLKQFFTTINWSSDSAINRIVPPALRETLRRRSFPKLVRRRTRSMPVREAARLILGAIHLR